MHDFHARAFLLAFRAQSPPALEWWTVGRESVDMAQKSGLLKARRSPYLHRLKLVFSIVCSIVFSGIFWYFLIFSGTSGIEFSADHRIIFWI